MTKKEIKLQEFFEQEEFLVHPFKQEGMQCAEIEKWTNGGVDIVIVLMPFTKEEFLDYVDDFDIDDNIDLYRQGEDYKKAFTITESVEDFTAFHKMLTETATKLANQS